MAEKDAVAVVGEKVVAEVVGEKVVAAEEEEEGEEGTPHTAELFCGP